MAKAININHVTLVVNNLEEASQFYENEMGLEVIPAFQLDFPASFFKLNDHQQLHLTEWPDDKVSFRGHVCFEVDDINSMYWRMKELGVIDINLWGYVRQLPDVPIQMFVRDPSSNLVELSCKPGCYIDHAILEDDLFKAGLYVSGRNDFRGYKSEKASLYHNS